MPVSALGGIKMPPEGVVVFNYVGTFGYYPSYGVNSVAAGNISLAASTWTTILSPNTGTHLGILECVLSSTNSGQVMLRYATTGAQILNAYISANSPIRVDYRPTSSFWAGTIGSILSVWFSVATNLSYTFAYVLIPDA